MAACVSLALCLAAAAPAQAGDLSFDAQCPLLLAQADNFAHACLANAQSVTRYFNYAPETHSAFVGPATPGSHFGLGCTLDDKRNLAFVGVYYTINPDNFRLATSATPAVADFDGNFGIIINGKLLNFIAVRVFETKFIPLVYYAVGEQKLVKNCEKDDLPIGMSRDIAGGLYYVQENPRKDGIWVHNCLSFSEQRRDDQCEPDYKYIQVVKGQQTKYYYFLTDIGFLDFIIESNGGFLMRERDIIPSCPFYRRIEGSRKLVLGTSIDPFEEVALSTNICFKFLK
jgi:hypothetical protein